MAGPSAACQTSPNGSIMEQLLKCRRFDVVRRPVTGSDGRPHYHEIVRHPGSVVILPLIDADQCLMIRQYRPAIDREIWELPAGTLDIPGEDPAAAAARELEEETGHRAARIEPLCEFYSAPGILDELLRAYVAHDLTATAQALEPTERIEVEPTPIDRALSMIRDGRIVDAKTMVTLLCWDMRRRESA